MAEEFDPTSLGAVAVDDYVDSGTDRTRDAVSSDFDPASLGAVPVDEQFDPRSLGAVEVEEPKKSGAWSSFKETLSSGLADLGASIVDIFTPPSSEEVKANVARQNELFSGVLPEESPLVMPSAASEALTGKMKEEASVLRGATPLAFEESDPTSKNIGAQIGRGAASVALMAPSLASGSLGLMALQGAGQAYESAYRQTEDQLKSQGVTDEGAISEQASSAGDKAAFKTAPHLLLYMAGGKAASGLAGKLLGKEASTLARGLTGAGTATVANVATSSVLRALEAKKGEKLSAAIPTIETLTADTLFGVYHGVGEYRKASLEVKRKAYQELQDRGFSKEEIKQTVAEQKSEAVFSTEERLNAINSALAEIEGKLGPREEFDPQTGRPRLARILTAKESELLELRKILMDEQSKAEKKSSPSVSNREMELIRERNAIVVSGKQAEYIERLGEIDSELQRLQTERLSSSGLLSEVEQAFGLKSPEEMVVESAKPPPTMAPEPAPEPVKAFDPSIDLVPHPATQKGEHIISTGILTPEGIAYGPDWNTRHADISKLEGPGKEIILKAMDEGMDFDQVEANKGFIVQDANWKRRFVGRGEAINIARKSGQVDESKLFTKDKLISEALIQPKGGEQNAETVRSDQGPIPKGGNVQEPSPITGSENLQQQAPGPTPEAAPKAEVTPDQAARELQQYREQAVAAAKSAGATDPGIAADIARDELLAKGITDRAAFIDAAKKRGIDQVRAAKKTVSEEEAPEPSTQKGPRAESLIKEDMDRITDKMHSLPGNQGKIMSLVGEQGMSYAEVAKELGITVDAVKQGLARARKALQSFIQDEGIGVSMGPGAASANEILVKYELRKFSKRFDEDQSIAEEVRKATGGRYYEPIPNKVSAEQAVKLIEERGEDVITEQIKDPSSDLSYADRVTVGEIVIKRLNKRYKDLKESNPEEASKLLDQTSDLAEWFAAEGTRLGQGVQAYAMWNRLTPAGKLRTFVRAVQKIRSRHKQNNRTEVEEIKEVLNSDTSKESKVRELTKLAKKNRTARKVKKDFNQLAEISKAGKVTDEKFYETLSDRLGLPKYDESVAKEIMRLAQKADEAPEGMPKQEALRDLNTYIAKQKGFDWSELPFGMYYGNMLSGVNTQSVNFIDTALNVQSEIVNLMITNPRAASAIMSGALRGASEGRWDAMLAMTEGRRISDGKMVEDPFFMEIAKFGEKGGVPITQGTRTGRVVKALAETRPAKFLNAYKFISRAMSASDVLSARAAQEAKAAQLAWRLAQEEGATGDALRSRIDEILGYDRLDDFRKQAQLEGFTGKKAEARAFELMELSRPEELQKASRDFASESTYNYKPYGLLGAASNKIEEFAKDYKALKLVVPFTRIVANVTNRGLNNSPYGFVRALKGKAGRGRSEKQFSTEERNALMVRATMGTVALASLLALHETGVIQISGQGPSDPEEKKQLRETGWRPYSIKIGNTYYTYTYTPVGLGLAVMGNMLDAIKYKGFSQKDALGVASYAFSSILSTLFNQSFLNSLSSLFEVASSASPAQQMNAMKRWSSRTLSSLAVPFSGLLRDVESMFDPSIPKPDTFTQSLISSIPFASQELKPQINAFGEPIKSLRNRFWKGENADPVWKFIADKQLRVPGASQFFDDPDQNYEYTKRSGQRMRKWMEQSLPMLRTMERKSAQDAMERQADYIRSIVRAELMAGGAKRKAKSQP